MCAYAKEIKGTVTAIRTIKPADKRSAVAEIAVSNNDIRRHRFLRSQHDLPETE
jgi:hypothetical protein